MFLSCRNKFCSANQLTVFYMMGTLVVKRLSNFWSEHLGKTRSQHFLPGESLVRVKCMPLKTEQKLVIVSGRIQS